MPLICLAPDLDTCVEVASLAHLKRLLEYDYSDLKGTISQVRSDDAAF